VQRTFRDVAQSKVYFDNLFGMVRGKDDPRNARVHFGIIVVSGLQTRRRDRRELTQCREQTLHLRKVGRVEALDEFRNDWL
jgi:hypothetical protein